MSQDPLLNQLADRVRSFSAGTGISLNRIAKLIETDGSNFSAFVNGRAGFLLHPYVAYSNYLTPAAANSKLSLTLSRSRKSAISSLKVNRCDSMPVVRGFR